jgi:hypothetical protein
MQTNNKQRTSFSIVGIMLGALLTLGLVAVGFNQMAPGQGNDSYSPQTVVTMHHPTDRGPGYRANFSDGDSTSSSKLGFDRDVATTHLAQRALRTAEAVASTDQSDATRRGKTTTAPDARDISDQFEGFRER